MANLQFLSNVLHNGIQFKGPQIKDNKQIADGMVIDLSQDIRGFNQPSTGTDGKTVAEHLVDRELARFTDAPATHTSNFVNAAQEAIPVDAPLGTGSAPVADQVKAREALQRAKQPENQTPPDGFPQRPVQAAPAPAPAQSNQPTPEEVAAAAASVS